MKQLFFILSLIGCMGCTTVPPNWWNPSGKYTADETPAAAQPAVVRPIRPAQNEIPAEENIEVRLDKYEELELEPLVDEGETSQEFAETTENSAENETLPPDGSLPRPSVLE